MVTLPLGFPRTRSSADRKIDFAFSLIACGRLGVGHGSLAALEFVHGLSQHLGVGEEILAHDLSDFVALGPAEFAGARRHDQRTEQRCCRDHREMPDMR